MKSPPPHTRKLEDLLREHGVDPKVTILHIIYWDQHFILRYLITAALTAEYYVLIIPFQVGLSPSEIELLQKKWGPNRKCLKY